MFASLPAHSSAASCQSYSCNDPVIKSHTRLSFQFGLPSTQPECAPRTRLPWNTVRSSSVQSRSSMQRGELDTSSIPRNADCTGIQPRNITPFSRLARPFLKRPTNRPPRTESKGTEIALALDFTTAARAFEDTFHWTTALGAAVSEPSGMPSCRCLAADGHVAKGTHSTLSRKPS